MISKVILGPRKVVWPLGVFLGPGPHVITTAHEETTEEWFLGILASRETRTVELTHDVTVPDPGTEDWDDGQWPLRGEFTFEDRAWKVIRDDDDEWGFEAKTVPHSIKKLDHTGEMVEVTIEIPGDPRCTQWFFHEGGKAGFIERVKSRNQAFLDRGRDLGWWDLHPVDGRPSRPSQKISIADMRAQNKTLMAHVAADMGIFKSVGEAKRNGWDRPIELGRHEIGPRNRRAYVEIVP